MSETPAPPAQPEPATPDSKPTTEELLTDNTGALGRAREEAARYRTKLRTVESERDGLQALVDKFQGDVVRSAASQPFDIEWTPEEQASRGSGTVVNKEVAGQIVPANSVQSGVRLRHPEDLFTLGGVSPADLIGDDGTIDQNKLQGTLKTLYVNRPELFSSSSGSVPNMGKQPTVGAPTASWQDVILGQ